MPRTQKPAGRAVDPRNGRRADLTVNKPKVERFDPPDGLLESSLEQWDAYWEDPVATVQTGVDKALLLRWITNLDRYSRLIEAADLEPLKRNSQGESANPLYAVAFKIEASLKADEAQLGIGPLNRSKLGIAVVTERRSLADMNSRYGGEGPANEGAGKARGRTQARGQESDAGHADPRLRVVDSTTA